MAEHPAERANGPKDFSIPFLNKVLCTLALFPMAALVAYRLLEALFYSPINVDAGCFLPLAERIAEGWIPYRNLQPGYTPLGIFTFAAVRLLVGTVSEQYPVYLGTVLMFEIATAVLIVVLGRLYSKDPFLGLFLGLLFLAGCQIHEGSLVFLEPFVTFFSTAALLIFLSGPATGRRLITAGVFVGLAFLSKQYGMAGLAPLAIGSIYGAGSVRIWLQRMTFLAAGFFAPPAVLLLYFAAFHGIGPAAIVSGFWVSGYVQTISGLTWVERFFFYRNVYLLLVPGLLLLGSYRNDRIFVVLATAFLAFLLPAGIRDFGHYCILFLPYAVLLGGYLVTRFQSATALLIRIFSVSALAALLPMAFECYRQPDLSRHPSARQEQYALAEKIGRTWPRRTPVVLFAEPWLNFAADFYPSGNWRGSYSFLSNVPAADLVQSIRSECNILVDTKSESYFTPARLRIEAEAGEFFSLLQSCNYRPLTTIDDRYQLWSRPCNRSGT